MVGFSPNKFAFYYQFCENGNREFQANVILPLSRKG